MWKFALSVAAVAILWLYADGGHGLGFEPVTPWLLVLPVTSAIVIAIVVSSSR